MGFDVMIEIEERSKLQENILPRSERRVMLMFDCEALSFR